MTTNYYDVAPQKRIVCGDARHVLRSEPAESVHVCITSPPYYGLRHYDAPASVWGEWRECNHRWEKRRRRGISGGTRSPLRRAKGRDNFQIVPRFDDAVCIECGAWLGQLGLEQTPEEYVEHLVEVFDEVRRVLRKDGVLWLNLGDCYWGSGKEGGERSDTNSKQKTSGGGTLNVVSQDDQPPSRSKHYTFKAKDLVGVPWMVALALRDRGWYLRSTCIWHKPNKMPESVKDRPIVDFEYVFLLTKARTYYWDYEGGLEPSKTDERQRRNMRCVWSIKNEGTDIEHLATYPAALVEKCLGPSLPAGGVCSLCGSPWIRGGQRGWRPQCRCGVDTRARPVVLDPFCGTGTTGAVAVKMHADFLGIDISPAYCSIAARS